MRVSNSSTLTGYRYMPSLRCWPLAAALALFLNAPSVSAQEGEGEQPAAATVTVNFESSSIADKAYTAGTKVNLGLGPDEIPTLPAVTSIDDTHEDAIGYTVTYLISGLPAGLTMRPGEASDRIIWGAPESATTNPVTRHVQGYRHSGPV